jgi:uncharacterized Zn finger protein
MPSVADLVDAPAIERLAKPSDIRLGRKIAEEGGVELIEFGPLRVTAKVGGVPASHTRRMVVLQSTPAGLSWSCTCTRNAGHFCKHCVAAAVVAWEKAPKRRK